MNGKLTLDTIKIMLLNNGLLLLAYLAVETVTTFATINGNVLPRSVSGVLELSSTVLYALCAASIVISLYKTFVSDLLLGKSYKYYSLPYKKSEIIFSKTIPAIIIESLIAALLFNGYLLINLMVALFFEEEYYTAVYGNIVLIEWPLRSFDSFVSCFMTAVTIGFLILLALVVSRSFDPSKTFRNLFIVIIIEVLVNYSVYTVAMIFSRYYPEIFMSIVLVIVMIAEIICSIIASKRLADKRFNVA